MQNMFNILLKKEMGKFLFLKICHKVFKKRLLIFHIGSFYKKSFNRHRSISIKDLEHYF